MRWFLLLLVLLGGACGEKPPACTLPPAVANAPPFLWKAQRADGAIVWLYGTIHNGGTADVPQVAWTALEGSRNFASELGDSEPDPDKTRDLSVIARGKGIDQLLPADDWYDLRDALRGRVKEDVLRRARPWYAMTQLMSAISPGPSPTMDFAMARRARDKKLGVDNLERWDEQLAALDGNVGIPDLQQAIHARKTMACELSTMLATYKTGDLAAMQKLLVVDGKTGLLGPRNKAWLPKIVAYFDRGGAFVAVGLGHMFGDEGLPALLEQAGYTVARQ